MGSHHINLILVSRPRFWIYLLGPFLVGIAAAWSGEATAEELVVAGILALSFLFPANLMIYGVNDVFDLETDRVNKKKQSYERRLPQAQHRRVMLLSGVLIAPMLIAAFWFSWLLGVVVLVFLFFGIGYSAPPIRAKAIPFLDSIFNGLYIVPGVAGFVLFSGALPAPSLIISAWLWAAAMHAYSAVPDINADRQVKLHTIATTLGGTGTIVVCAALYAFSGILAFSTIGWYAGLGIGLYVALMIASLVIPRNELMKIYRIFPYVNSLYGAGLFFLALNVF